MIADYGYELIPEDLFLRVLDVAGLNRFYFKVEGLNPAGSIKLKTARALVEAAEASCADLGDTHFIESTSGNLGIALAVICAAKGYKLTCVCDPNANAPAVAMIRALGAEVVVVTTRDANSGYLGSRLEYIRQRLAVEPNLYWLNQYANPSNPAAHEQATAPAVLAAFGRVDYLFVGVGTGGTLMGCVDYFRRRSASTRIIAVDAVGSVSFGSEPATRHIPGLGTSRKPELLDRYGPDEVLFVSEADTVRECRWLARRTGLLAGGSTGTVLAAVRERGATIPADSTVVAIAPDIGDRYLSSVYDDSWVIDHGLEGALEQRLHEAKEPVDVLV